MDGLMLLFLLIGLSGGLLVGLLVGWFVGRREGEKKAHGEQAMAATEAEPLVPEEKETPLPAQQEADVALPSLGLLLRRRAGMLEVVLDGVVYRNHATMPTDSRNRLLAYLRLVRTWMEGKPTESEYLAATPSFSMVRNAATGRGVSVASQRDMIARIDEILQELLAETGLSTPVRVVAGLKGGVNILVGLQRYESVADIPDAEVQTLVRKAAQRWEMEQ